MNEIYLIIITLIFSAFFSGLEIAFISANRLQLELTKNQGFSGKILSLLAKNPSHFIAATLIGNTLSLSFYGIYTAKLFGSYLEQNLPMQFNNDVSVFILQIIISTAIVLLTAEFLPKSLFLISPNKLLKFFALPMLLVFYTLFPLVFLIIELSKLVITKVFRLEFSNASPAFGLTDLNQFVSNTVDKEEELDLEIDTKILYNALEFKSLKVRECMIPRTEIISVEIEDGIEVLSNTFIESGHSKILVYKESIDNILGYCQSKQMFKKPDTIKEILISLIIVPETMLANELLVQFIQDNRSIALVVDEFGGTAGIVTMEDVIEEILGDIQDEHDDEQLLEQKISDNSFLFSARHEIDYLNEEYELNLAEGDYETLGGLILLLNQDIPEEGDIIETETHIFELIKTQNNRIEIVKVLLKP